MADTRGWNPIETAPRDGTEVLVARGRQMGVAFWFSDRWNLGCTFVFVKPTHWMPLPEAPLPAPPEDTRHDEA